MASDLVLIPRENEKDLDEIDREVASNLHFVLCDTVDDVLAVAPASPATASATTPPPQDATTPLPPVTANATVRTVQQ